MHACAKFISHNKTNKPIGNEKFADTVLKFLLTAVVFRWQHLNLDLDLKSIDLKCLDLKSFDFKIHCLGLFK